MEIPGLSWLSWQLVVLLITLLVIFLYRHFTLLKRLGIPGPTPLPLVGNLPEQFFRGIEKTDEEWIKKYGKVFGYYSGYRPSICITDTEMIKTILIKDFQNFPDRPSSGHLPKLLLNGLFFMQGRTWKRTRNIITPTFSSGKVRNLVPIINKCAQTLVTNMQERVGEDVNVREVFTHFTIDAIASTAFGIDIDSQKNPDDPFVMNLDPIFKIRPLMRIPILLSAAVPGLGKILYKLGLSNWPTKSVQFYEDTGNALIKERRTNKMNKTDFMQLLMNAEFDDNKHEYIHNQSTISNGESTGQPNNIIKLSDDEINSQAFVFFIAGYETTASLLRYAAYTLSLHPDIDRKLHEEIDKHVGQNEPDYESVGNLKYMDQFVNELLRFYPPLPRLNRIAKEDTIVHGIRIPKGTAIHIPVWAVHHSKENYSDPDTFDPERFSPDRKGAVDSVTYLPFGAGPRNCIGMRLALVEAKIALIYMLREIRFEKCDQTKVPLELVHFGLLRPKTPIVLSVQKR